VLLGDLIGDAGLTCVQCLAAIDATLDPPIVEIEQYVRLARGVEKHLPGFLVAVLAAEPLDAIEPQARIGFDRIRRESVEQLAGVAAPLNHGNPGSDLLLLIGGKQLCHAERGGGRRFVVRIKQPIDPRAMNIGGEHVAVLGEDLGLDRLVQLVIAPSRGDEVAGALLVALFQIDAGESRLASAGLRARRGEERLDRLGTGIVEEESGLGLLA
jgi:hypothetical protein